MTMLPKIFSSIAHVKVQEHSNTSVLSQKGNNENQLLLKKMLKCMTVRILTDSHSLSFF